MTQLKDSMSDKDKIRQEIERRMLELARDKYIDLHDTLCRTKELNLLLAFIDSLPEESENHGCGVEFPHFGANYPDAKCIDGYLWDMDSYEDGIYTIGGDDPCPICNTEKWLKDALDDEIFKTRDEALEYVKMLKSKYKHKDSLSEEPLIPSNSVGLKEEINNYFKGLWPGTETAEQCNTDLHFTPLAIMRLASHFAEWGAKH